MWDKCTYECAKCGSMYQSKGESGHIMFPINNTNEEETHINRNSRRGLISINKLCVCPDLDQRESLDEEEAEREYWDTHPNECDICHNVAPFRVNDTIIKELAGGTLLL